MADLVLVRSCFSNPAEKHWVRYPPLGLAYLASSSRHHGISVEIVDGKLEGHISPEQTAERIISHNPKYVGITAMTVEYPTAKQIARIIKNSKTNPLIIIGGPHANALSERTLKESPEFDFVIAGEGETSLVNLIRADREHEQIPGLFRRDKDGIIRNSTPPQYEEDPANLPFPAWDILPRTDIYPVMTERGCPFNCVFCSHNMSRMVRRRPVEHVMDEIKWIYDSFKPSEIHFEDETFGLNPEHTIRLLDSLIAFNNTAKLKFKAQTRVDRVNEPMIERMKQAGFEYLELGVESGDPEVLERSGKGIDLEQVERAVEIVRKVGMKVWFKLIIGLPGETRETIRRSIDFAVKHNPERLSVATIVAYPGSDIYRWALEGKYGYKLITDDWGNYDKYLSSSLELENLSSRALRRFQIQTYLEVYLRNLRFLELVKLFIREFSLLKYVLRQMIPFIKTSDK